MLEAAIRYVNAHGPFTVAGGPAATQTPADEAHAAVDVVAAEWLAPERLAVTVRINEPFHLYAADSELGQAVALTSQHPALVEVEAPPAFGGIYHGDVVFTLVFRAPVSDGAVEVSLRYQACDESRCLMPVTKGYQFRPAAATP